MTHSCTGRPRSKKSKLHVFFLFCSDVQQHCSHSHAEFYKDRDAGGAAVTGSIWWKTGNTRSGTRQIISGVGRTLHHLQCLYDTEQYEKTELVTKIIGLIIG